tara:strand:- start:256 stop:1206 length:951 start_codon:yes stop_codon:yes gene_type:complete
LKKNLKIFIPLILGILFVSLTYLLTSQSERVLIWSYITSAKIEFVLFAMGLGALADIIRGLRWRLLSKSIGYNSGFISSIGSVFICYTSNMAIPRSGEIVRATILSKYNNIPLGKTFGTIAAERIIDIIISILILLFVWFFQNKTVLESLLKENDFDYLEKNFWFIIIIVSIFVIGFFLFLSKIKKVKKFFKSIIEGVLSLTKLKRNIIPFLIFSIFIWSCYLLAFFVIKFSVPELNIVNNTLILSAFIVGVFSISLSNHGFGVYPLAISLYLSNFGINTEIGLTYGWIAWSCQAVITLIFGGLSFFVLPLLKTRD